MFLAFLVLPLFACSSNKAPVKQEVIFDIIRDSDGDGILDDGDKSGFVGDNRCTDNLTSGCDDNCVSVSNIDQKDTDADGIGDVCDSNIGVETVPYPEAKPTSTSDTSSDTSETGPSEGITFSRADFFAGKYSALGHLDGYGLPHYLEKGITIEDLVNDLGNLPITEQPARIYFPRALALHKKDAKKSLYLSESNALGLYSFNSGREASIAGDYGLSGNAIGNGKSALFDFVKGLAVVPDELVGPKQLGWLVPGDLVVADSRNGVLKKINENGIVDYVRFLDYQNILKVPSPSRLAFVDGALFILDNGIEKILGDEKIWKLSAEIDPKTGDPKPVLSEFIKKWEKDSYYAGGGGIVRHNDDYFISLGKGLHRYYKTCSSDSTENGTAGQTCTFNYEPVLPNDIKYCDFVLLVGDKLYVPYYGASGGTLAGIDLSKSAVDGYSLQIIAGSTEKTGYIDSNTATEARFESILADAVYDPDENTIILADLANNAIRSVRLGDGAVSTLIGIPPVEDEAAKTAPGPINDPKLARFDAPILAFNPIKGGGEKIGELFIGDLYYAGLRKTAIVGPSIDNLPANFSLEMVSPDIWGSRYAFDENGVSYTTRTTKNALEMTDFAGDKTTLLAGKWGTTGDCADGVGEGARFNKPFGLAWLNGYLYVADMLNHAIRRIDVNGTDGTPGYVKTFAGKCEVSGNADGLGQEASFFQPYLILAIKELNALISVEFELNRIRKIDETGAVVTLLPGGKGYADGQAGSALFKRIADIDYLLNDAGEIELIIEDAGAGTIRKLNLATLNVMTLLGVPNEVAAIDGDTKSARLSNLQTIQCVREIKACFVSDGTAIRIVK